MMSKRYFFKYMREDLRHKTWLIALSVLGNMLALPIAFMILQGNIAQYDTVDINYAPSVVSSYVEQLYTFFESYSLITAGIIAAVGAVIVGITSFRYLQNKSMADTFQSIPLKKRELFLAGYLNGFVIWFIPMIIAMVISILLGAARYGAAVSFFNALPTSVLPKVNPIELPGFGSMFVAALGTIGLLILIYLLTYHLMLVAVVMTGNALNTLVVAAVLGVGVISVYACIGLLEHFFLTTILVSFFEKYLKLAIYFSPAALVVVLFSRMSDFFREGHYVIAAILSTGLLGAGAYIGFIKRPVELAEQGTKNQYLSALCNIVASLVAGVGGWFIFTFVLNSFGAGSRSVAWGTFGCVLVSVFVSGVMNVIFHMEFGAFFKKKIIMAIGVCTPLLLCLLFFFDICGLDEYLPKKSEIASMGILETGYADWTAELRYDFDDKRHPINQMKVTDPELIYPILENAIRNVESDGDIYYEYDEDGETYDVDYETYYDHVRSDTLYVRVTLKSGKTYYRKYTVKNSDDNSALYQILTSKEYAKYAFLVDEDAYTYLSDVSIYGGAKGKYSYLIDRSIENMGNQKLVRELILAFNQDILEHPEAAFGNEDKAYARLDLYGQNEEHQSIDKSILITDKMEHMLQVLRANGLEEYTTVMKPSDVSRITLSFDGIDNVLEMSDEEFSQYLYGYYGLVMENATKAYDFNAVKTQMEQSILMDITISNEDYAPIQINVVNQEDIAELMERLSADISNYYWGVFDQRQICVTVTDTKGMMHDYVIKRGELPEKYALFFRAAKALNSTGK